MQLDKAALDRMLSLDDAQLRRLIAQLGAGAGIASDRLKISDSDLAALRKTLGTASPEALARIAAQFSEQNRGSSRGQ